MTWGKDNASRARDSFEDQWPDLVRGLDNALRARRVPASRREDIIQETGLRLFVRWSDLDPERPVWPFALTISMNLLKDEQRMQARRSASPPHVEETIESGVEEEALARLELTSVQVALQKLTPAQRSVLLADLGQVPYDDRGPAALKMLRMRARRTLRNVINRASALIPLAGIKLRRALNSFGLGVQRNAGAEQAQIVVLSTLGIAGAATFLSTALGMVHPARVWPEGTAGVAEHTVSTSAQVPSRPAHGFREAEEVGEFVARPRALRARPLGGRHVHRRGAGEDTPQATVDAGGTGIDDDPSLRSERWRVWVVAQATVYGREAAVGYEVEQANPVCGSPTGAEGATRTCVRPAAPRARGRAGVGGVSAGLPPR